jgi:hypothetical protein
MSRSHADVAPRSAAALPVIAAGLLPVREAQGRSVWTSHGPRGRAEGRAA